MDVLSFLFLSFFLSFLFWGGGRGAFSVVGFRLLLDLKALEVAEPSRWRPGLPRDAPRPRRRRSRLESREPRDPAARGARPGRVARGVTAKRQNRAVKWLLQKAGLFKIEGWPIRIHNPCRKATTKGNSCVTPGKH